MNDRIPSGLGAVDRVDSGAGAESVHQVSAVPSDVVSVSEARFTPNVARVFLCLNVHDELLAALTGLLNHYVRLVDSGDAGNWDAEKEPQVIAARAAIAAATGGKTA